MGDKEGQRGWGFEYTSGKWMLFIPNTDFIEVFRKVAKLTINLELTNSFKANGGTEKEHVFCIYCKNYKEIKFVRKIAMKLWKEGFIDKYGVKYKDGTRAIFFKPDEATDRWLYSDTGDSGTLYKFTNDGKLFFKEYDHDYKPHWTLVEDDNNVEILDNYETYIGYKDEKRGMVYIMKMKSLSLLYIKTETIRIILNKSE